MLSYVFGGLGEFVAPRTVCNKEVKYFLEGGRFDEVLAVIKHPPHDINVNELYDTGRTPLHMACAGGALELAVELISQGADCHAKSTETQNTPLHFASLSNNRAIVEVLLRSGAEPGVPNAEGLIPAELTANSSVRESLLNSNRISQREVKHLLALREEAKSDVPGSNQEALAGSSITSNGASMEESLRSGAELSVSNTKDVIPAEMITNSSVQESLLDTQGTTNEEQSLFMEEAKSEVHGSSKTVFDSPLNNSVTSIFNFEVLKQELKSRNISEYILRNNSLAIGILEAVSRTAESEATDKTEGNDRKSVFSICSRPSISDEMIADLQYLLHSKPELAISRAVNMGAQASNGWTPLHCAAKYRNIKVAEVLLRCDNVSGWEVDLMGKLPLHIAASTSNGKDICNILKQAMQGCNIVQSENCLSTPPSASSNRVSIVGRCAPVDVHGTTPLGSATREAKGKPSTDIRQLLYGVNDNSIFSSIPPSCRSGRTPFKHRKDTAIIPSTAVAIEKHELELNLLYAHSEAQGWRGEMEDALIVQCPIRNDFTNIVTKWCCFGVLDGHGGNFSSKFIQEKLSVIIANEISKLVNGNEEFKNAEVCDILINAFINADRFLSCEPRMKVKSTIKRCLGDDKAKDKDTPGVVQRKFDIMDKSGSTACVCLIGPSDIITANLGDSRAVLAKMKNNNILSVGLSNDHKPGLESEMKRVEASGCSLQKLENKSYDSYEISTPLESNKKERLRVARSFGDFRFKWALDSNPRPDSSFDRSLTDVTSQVDGFRALSPSEQAVTCVPEVLIQTRSAEDEFIIIACDGVWDVLSSQEAVEFVHGELQMNSRTGAISEATLSTVCDNLVQECLDKEISCDEGTSVEDESLVGEGSTPELQTVSSSQVHVNDSVADMNSPVLNSSSPIKGTRLF